MEKVQGMSFIEFTEKFNSEEKCRDHLLHLRVKDGYKCPKCSHGKYAAISTRNLLACNKCNHQMSATNGTAMDKTKIPLTKWFAAMYMMSNDKRGCSATKLSKDLSLPYNTAWYLHKRIQSAMSNREEQYVLEGIVQFDDSYVGAKKKGGKRGRSTKKPKFAAALSLHEEGRPKYLKLKVMKDLKGKTIGKFAKRYIRKGTTVRSDAYRSYRKPLVNDYLHEYQKAGSDPEHLRWLHTVISNCKAFIQGTYHGLGRKHLQLFLDEFCFRFNRRFLQNYIFDRLLVAVASSSPIRYRALI